MVLSGEYDLVNASRLEHRPATMPLANYLANWVFAFTAWVLAGVNSTDLHSGMRAYSHRVIRQVEVDPDGPALPVDLLLKPALQGFRIHEVFIPYGERIGETTLQRWSSTLWTFRRIFRLALSRLKVRSVQPIWMTGARVRVTSLPAFKKHLDSPLCHRLRHGIYRRVCRDPATR